MASRSSQPQRTGTHSRPTSVETSSEVVLTPQCAIARSSRSGKTTKKGYTRYTIKVRTKLKNITGFRLEAMIDATSWKARARVFRRTETSSCPSLRSLGRRPTSPNKPARLKFELKRGCRLYAGSGFNISRTINEVQTTVSLGWAVAPAQATPHWAVGPTNRADWPMRKASS